MLALLSLLSRSRRRRSRAVRQSVFESLEIRNMPAVLVDVGYHLVEPNASGQTITLSVFSTTVNDPAVSGFDLRAQIVTAKQGPYFQGVQFAGDLWNSFPHIESGSAFPANRTLATGDVSFTSGFQARAEGTLVKLTIDTTGIAAGSYEFRLVGTLLGSSSFRRADGSSVSEVITNGTLQVRSIWQNPDDPNDINGDGRVSPLDVLLLLNELSKKGAHELQLPSPGEESAPFYDVNGDGYLSPLDPLGAINCLNGLGCVTSPQPILAQVTPDFKPEIPGSTSAGHPVPDVETPPYTGPCVYYGVDEDGNPIPVFDPDVCDDIPETDPDIVPIPPDTTPGNPAPLPYPDPAPTSEAMNIAAQSGSVKNLPDAHVDVATVLPAASVDVVIVELADELSDEDEGGGLFALGFDDLFAISS